MRARLLGSERPDLTGPMREPTLVETAPIQVQLDAHLLIHLELAVLVQRGEVWPDKDANLRVVLLP